MRRTAGFLLVLLVLAGCDSSDPAFDIADYVGTYEGTRTVTDSDGSTDTEDISFTISADTDAQTVAFALRPEAGASEVLPGTYDEDGIEALLDAGIARIGFSVSRDGSVTGTFSAFNASGTISGTLTPSRFDLLFRDEDGRLQTEIRTSR